MGEKRDSKVDQGVSSDAGSKPRKGPWKSGVGNAVDGKETSGGSDAAGGFSKERTES